MTTNKIRRLVSAVLVGGALTIGTGAQAYWGGPMGGPWGGPMGGPWGGPVGGPWGGPMGGPWGGPMGGPWGGPSYGPGNYPSSGYEQAIGRTQERRRKMHDHKNAMRAVLRMLSGQRKFDRAEAGRLVREIEASAGDNLAKLFKTGDWQGSPSSRARVDDMKDFRARADALKEAAGALADELEKQPSAEDVRTGQAFSPELLRSSRRRTANPFSRGRSEGEAVSTGVLDAYSRLVDTCGGCHADFRTSTR
jgi:cytochrome c556